MSSHGNARIRQPEFACTEDLAIVGEVVAVDGKLDVVCEPMR